MKEKSLQKIQNITHEDIHHSDFEMIKVYINDDHFIRKLLKHIPSDELYFYEFKEDIDYVNGNDPQYRTYIPVKDEVKADEINKLDIFGIHTISPRLIDDWLADDTRRTLWI
jgi:UDP-N-acetylmuramate-alanine ligase